MTKNKLKFWSYVNNCMDKDTVTDMDHIDIFDGFLEILSGSDSPPPFAKGLRKKQNLYFTTT